MPRKFTEKKLVIASHNPGKIIEINDFHIVSLKYLRKYARLAQG